MSIRCSALLLKARRTLPADEFAAILRAACMAQQAAEEYMQFAVESPRLREICARRNGRVTEEDALNLLRRGQEGQANPLPDLRTLQQIIDK